MFKQYKEAIEKSNIISKTDVNGIITFVNDEFCKISGYTQEELIGSNHNIVRHPDVSALKFKLLWDTIKAKNIYKNTVRNLAKNGTTFYVNTTVVPILDEFGEIEEFIAIRYDVTKEVFYKQELQRREFELEELNATLEKRVEEKTAELQELNATLEQRVKKEISKNEEKQKVMFWQSRLASLGEMLANIAHQWRQPLTELNLTLFSMKKEALNKNDIEVEKLYSDSKNIIQNMSTTIDDFTNFFKPNKAQEYFKIEDSINESLSILEQLLEKEMVSVNVDIEVIEVFGIANELSQVLINLFKNSIDAFINSGVLIREIKVSVKRDGEFASIEFQDNAGGINDKRNIYKIFEPYYTTKHKSQGTGLGLFMSKMICEKGLDGSINVESKKSMTVFTIKIPLRQQNA